MIQYSLFVVDILNQLLYSKAYAHPYYAEMIIVDIMERYGQGEVPLEVFVAFCNLITKIGLGETARKKVEGLILGVIRSPPLEAVRAETPGDGKSTPKSSESGKNKMAKAG